MYVQLNLFSIMPKQILGKQRKSFPEKPSQWIALHKRMLSNFPKRQLPNSIFLRSNFQRVFFHSVTFQIGNFSAGNFPSLPLPQRKSWENSFGKYYYRGSWTSCMGRRFKMKRNSSTSLRSSTSLHSSTSLRSSTSLHSSTSLRSSTILHSSTSLRSSSWSVDPGNYEKLFHYLRLGRY